MQIIKIEEQIINQPHMCVFLIQKLLIDRAQDLHAACTVYCHLVSESIL